MESAEDEPMAFLTPTKEVLLLGEDPESQRAEAYTPCIPVWPKEAITPDDAVR